MAQVTGVRSTGNITSNKLVIDMSEKIGLLQPNAEPFMSFLKMAKSRTETASNPKFEWLEDDLGARWDAVNNAAGYLATDTTIAVDNGDYFAAGFLVKVPRTGEVMLVTAVATNNLTVTRGYGSTAAAALVDNDPLVIIGNANEEGAGTLTLKSTLEAAKFNYTQLGA